MKIFAPDYYKDFKCIAGLCKHSCCIGWEIDIDDDTFHYYESIDTAFGKYLRDNITNQDGYNCFKLKDNGRCPFLNSGNLCDIILNLGEAALCQICSDHPRFRNFYSDRIEIGLGLCCEEAARLILTSKSRMSLVEIENDGDDFLCEEAKFFSWRDSLFEYFYDNGVPITDKMSINDRAICSKEVFEKMTEKEKLSLYNCFFDNAKKTDNITFDNWLKSLFEKYLTLEILDNKWKILLKELIKEYESIKGIEIPTEFTKCFEQLLIYFTYRHSSLLLCGISKSRIIKFVKMSASIIYALCQLHISKSNNLYIVVIIEYSRMYSSEIEYSQDNLDSLI